MFPGWFGKLFFNTMVGTWDQVTCTLWSSVLDPSTFYLVLVHFFSVESGRMQAYVYGGCCGRPVATSAVPADKAQPCTLCRA